MISCVRTLRGFFAAGISSGALLALLPVGASAQQPTYVACETVAGAIDYVEVRDIIREMYPDDPAFAKQSADIYVAENSEDCSHRERSSLPDHITLARVDWYNGEDFDGVNSEAIYCHLSSREGEEGCVDYVAGGEAR